MVQNRTLWLVFFSLLLLKFCFRTVHANLKTPKIIGGKAASISNLKYLVYLRRYGKFACGGTLVGSRYVVTAAHCVKNYPATAITVTGGATYLNQGGLQRRVSRIFIAPNFSLSTMNNDVAVLKLKSPMIGKNIQPIRLCSRNLPVGATLHTSGWGITRENSSRPSIRLLTTTIKLKSKASCRRSHGNAITNSMMCAKSPRTDTCSGDSGGPVIYKGELCGIVSWGMGCARPNYAGVYTIINRVKYFIRRSMSN